ncbi:NAD(P)H-binding protein [Paenibacillus sp. GD4]|uniref:NAD(P)H-binding protein n=1 Tax=Paenibacillus sp. GD4 TaxID=3068890 RepID=UPI0027966430|nr:NAD(P)H-binding protein [Paenibacillus sp. GD4]MDQ1911810.1 NAD(P)H-binding protein [Paenibacillus sp. GD4]
MKKALVAGATGLVGRELVRILLNQEEYAKVTVLVRRRMNLEHPKLEQLVVDYDRLEGLAGELVEGASLFCTLGTTMKQAGSKELFELVDYEYPMTLGRLAKRYGAEQMLIVTAMGAKRGSLFYYNRVKGKVEEELGKLGLPKLCIFRPSLLLGDRQEKRAGEQAAMKAADKLPFLFSGPLERYKPIRAEQVAAAMAAAANNNIEGTRIYESRDIAAMA